MIVRMEAHEYETIAQLHGSIIRKNCPTQRLRACSIHAGDYEFRLGTKCVIAAEPSLASLGFAGLAAPTLKASAAGLGSIARLLVTPVLIMFLCMTVNPFVQPSA